MMKTKIFIVQGGHCFRVLRQVQVWCILLLRRLVMPPRRGVDFRRGSLASFVASAFATCQPSMASLQHPRRAKGKAKPKVLAKVLAKALAEMRPKTKGQAEVPKSPRRSSIVPRRSRKESSSAGSSRCHGQCRRSGGSVASGGSTEGHTSASDHCPTRPNPPCDVHVLFTAAELRQFASEHTHIAQQMRLGCPGDLWVRV